MLFSYRVINNTTIFQHELPSMSKIKKIRKKVLTIAYAASDFQLDEMHTRFDRAL